MKRTHFYAGLLLSGLPILIVLGFTARLSTQRPPREVGALVQGDQITVVIPKGADPLDFGPSGSVALRIVGMRVSGRGLEGYVATSDKRTNISRATPVLLVPTDKGSFVDLEISGPLTLTFKAGSDLVLVIRPAYAFGTDVGLQAEVVPAVEYAVQANSAFSGTMHAKRVRIRRTHNMLTSGKLIAEISLSSPLGEERTGPIGFSTGPGSTGRVRVAFNASVREADQGIQTRAKQVEIRGASGRLAVGTRSIVLTGLETVELRGSLTLARVRLHASRVAASLRGEVAGGSVGGESILLTDLQRVVSEPLFTVAFTIVIVVVTALVGAGVRLMVGLDR